MVRIASNTLKIEPHVAQNFTLRHISPVAWDGSGLFCCGTLTYLPVTRPVTLAGPHTHSSVLLEHTFLRLPQAQMHDAPCTLDSNCFLSCPKSQSPGHLLGASLILVTRVVVKNCIHSLQYFTLSSFQNIN